MALIINEQNFIDDRVVHNNNHAKLAGIRVTRFNDLASRIETGKHLNRELFHERLQPCILRIADQQPKLLDAWNTFFTDSPVKGDWFNGKALF